MSQTKSISSNCQESLSLFINNEIDLKEAESFLHFARRNAECSIENTCKQKELSTPNDSFDKKVECKTLSLIALGHEIKPAIEKYQKQVVPKTLPDGVFWTTKIEAGINRYVCPIKGCEKSFTRPQNLKSHYLVHTGEKPFSCPDCDRPFQRRSDLKRHGKVHLVSK